MVHAKTFIEEMLNVVRIIKIPKLINLVTVIPHCPGAADRFGPQASTASRPATSATRRAGKPPIYSRLGIRAIQHERSV